MTPAWLAPTLSKFRHGGIFYVRFLVVALAFVVGALIATVLANMAAYATVMIILAERGLV